MMNSETKNKICSKEGAVKPFGHEQIHNFKLRVQT